MDFKRILGIAACDPQGVMGNKGKLPWNYPEDVKFFAEITAGVPLIMGHRTFLSLPDRYFKGRTSIVFSRQKFSIPNVIFVSSLTEFFSLPEQHEDLYLIGGTEMYSLFLKKQLVREFLLTRIKNSYEGDVFFPLSLLKDWKGLKIRETEEFTIYRYYHHE